MEALIPELAKLGVLGTMIVLMGMLLLRCDRRNSELEKRNSELQKLLHESYEHRISENRQNSEVIRGNMTALHAFTETMKAFFQRGSRK